VGCISLKENFKNQIYESKRLKYVVHISHNIITDIILQYGNLGCSHCIGIGYIPFSILLCPHVSTHFAYVSNASLLSSVYLHLIHSFTLSLVLSVVLWFIPVLYAGSSWHSLWRSKSLKCSIPEFILSCVQGYTWWHWRVLVQMIGFISTSVTTSLNDTQLQPYRYSTHFTIIPH
jgi:predicted small integral membrane protein